jgi:hypothetical protein
MMFWQIIPVLCSQKKNGKNSKKRYLGPMSRSKKIRLSHIVSLTPRPVRGFTICGDFRYINNIRKINTLTDDLAFLKLERECDFANVSDRSPSIAWTFTNVQRFMTLSVRFWSLKKSQTNVKAHAV